ncbi:MAG TPA: HNH endonuclease signature motif containing protein [Nitrobacter sp.]|nr:HNH endonuclease signature motif containing protein [Nitrobacter sp.]
MSAFDIADIPLSQWLVHFFLTVFSYSTGMATHPTPPEPQPYRCRHWIDELPYRALVHVKDSGHGTPLYMVAGSNLSARKASSALKEALKIHGGQCFYCKADGDTLSGHLNVDHVEPQCLGGTDLLHNLVVSCTPCNSKKGALPVEAFSPNAGRAWLLGVKALIRARLELLSEEGE